MRQTRRGRPNQDIATDVEITPRTDRRRLNT
jgi:hypothetical protein